MKIALNYNPSNSSISDNAGVVLINWPGLENHEIKDTPEGVSIEGLIDLKKAGFTTDEIVELRKKEIL